MKKVLYICSCQGHLRKATRGILDASGKSELSLSFPVSQLHKMRGAGGSGHGSQTPVASKEAHPTEGKRDANGALTVVSMACILRSM